MSDQDHQTANFDYRAAADLFSPRLAGSPRPLVYRRFASASAAIQFAIEGLSPATLLGTYLEVGDERYGALEIRRLYDQHSQAPMTAEAHVAN